MADRPGPGDVMALPDRSLTFDEFVAWEQHQERKHEFVDGRVYEFQPGPLGPNGLAGGTLAHNGIAATLLAEISSRIQDGPCRAYGSDVLVATSTSGRYPDVVVSCDERDQDFTALSLRYPKFVVEVLSESTAAIDRGEKADEYRAIETLEEYVLIDSRKRWAEVYSRRPDGAWVVSLPIKAGTLHVRSLDLSVDLDVIYSRFGIKAS